MRTISNAVEQVLAHSPFLVETLTEDIANNAKIARRIHPEVEKILMEDVSEGAIAMAIHRLTPQLRKPLTAAMLVKKLSNIVVRSHLVEFIFENSADSSQLFASVAKEAHGHRSSFLNFSRGIHESMLIVSDDLEEHTFKSLKGMRGLRVRKGLSAITMQLPEGSLPVPGIYYLILKALTHEGISMVEIVSVMSEFSIVIEDNDVDRAFSVVKRLQ
jgi:hypothetical protein